MSVQNAVKIKADILVIGGAITGIFAAIRAKEMLPSLEVIIVDKGRAGRTGCANWAGGNISYVLPSDDIEELMKSYLVSGAGLADPQWIQFALEETYDRVNEMISWGVPFERDENGQILRKGGRGGGALSAVCSGKNLLSYMRRKAQQLGVRFIDKVMVTELIIDEHRQVRGGVGFKVGIDPVEPIVFLVKAVVLAAGPCSFKAAYIGHRMATGDGLSMAFRHGAQAMGMEFAVAHNTGPRDFDISGMARFVAMGGKFVNKLGEEFMLRYDPVLGNKANFGTLIYAMANEVNEGRGPTYFDMTRISSEDYELSRKILPHTFLALKRSGIDIRRNQIEWIPCFSGNRGSGAGLRIDESMAVNGFQGLFTGGDTGGKYHYGANAGYIGWSFGWCAVSGWRAGQSAVRFTQESELISISSEDIERALVYQEKPLKIKGMTADEATSSLQDALIPYKVVIIKEEKRLCFAVEQVEQLIKQNVSANDAHELMKAHETLNMLLLAKTILRASLIRKESRGMHYREDFPKRDDSNWQKWLYVSQINERLVFNT